MTQLRTLLAGLLFALSASGTRAHAQSVRRTPPDLVLLDGRIFTSSPAKPWAEAIAIRGDRIIAVGRARDIAALAGSNTRRMQLGGRLVLPGFNDAHDHVGAPLPGIVFATSDNAASDPPLVLVLDSLRTIAARAPRGVWLSSTIDARMLDDPRARREALDSVAPHNPVWLSALTGHGAILNTAALRALGISDDARDPVGGFYEREGAPYPGRGTGRVTGLLNEYARWNAERVLGSAQPDSVLVEALRRHAQRAVAWGVTSIQDMTGSLDPATTLRVLRIAKLPVRMRIIAMAMTDTSGRRTREWDAAFSSSGFSSHPPGVESNRTIDATKWILDGTGIERLSFLRRPFADRPPWSGQLNFPADTVRLILREALESHRQPILHAIGDSTIALVLSEMEAMAPASTWRAVRLRLEHAEWLTADLRARAMKLGVVVVENPSHFTDGDARMRSRFGRTRRHYQPLRSIVDAGIPLGIGSDGEPNPFVNLELAVTHPDNPPEALPLATAVIAYTRGSAYAEFSESRKGTLAVGMLADLTVLSHDIFVLPADSIAATHAVVTIIGGAVAYDAGALSASCSSCTSAIRRSRSKIALSRRRRATTR